MIDTAILLAAGEGSRLRSVAASKPLCRVGGVALIDHALRGLHEAGMARVIVVLGYRGDAIAAHLALSNYGLMVETVTTPDYRQPNGVSVLAARDALGDAETLLAMCDHLVEPTLYRRMAEAGAGAGLKLGIDKRLGHPWVDPLDVTCVATNGDRITAIGKEMTPHDCYDVGVFAIGPAAMAALASLDAPSLTEGVRVLAARGAAQVVDCSDLGWIDVDDAKALAQAEEWFSTKG